MRRTGRSVSALLSGSLGFHGPLRGFEQMLWSDRYLSLHLITSQHPEIPIRVLMTLKTFEFVVHGTVQGVGFRHFVATTARADGIVGWVRNRSVSLAGSNILL